MRWKSPDLYTEITSPVVLDGFIYGCQYGPYVGESSLRCIDLETGRLRWEKRFSEDPVKKSVSLMAADDKLIILTDTGTLAVAQADRRRVHGNLPLRCVRRRRRRQAVLDGTDLE